MPTPLIPQEIYLLERYSSPVYFGEMRDAWANMLEAAEAAMEQFMRRLAPDHRRRPLPQQFDVTWGERVLPNFRSTLQMLDEEYVRVSRGELSALSAGYGVGNDATGQRRDYPNDWMPEALADRFDHWQHQADMRASNLDFTEGADWIVGDLTSRYAESARGPLDAPPTWPIYKLSSTVTTHSGHIVGRTGIYLPACDDSCASLLIKGYEACQATVGYNPETTQRLGLQDTTWTLVERIADEGGGIPGQENVSQQQRLNVQGGEPCPQAGWWSTPAKVGGRRYFKAGEVMPMIEGSDYGHTYWQWDADQAAPKL